MSFLVMRVSSAVFSDTLANDANYFNVGDIELADPQSTASALFEVDDMTPGQTETKCINVAYTGPTTASGVKVYTTGYTDSGTLDTQLDVVITEGSGAAGAGDCTGFANDTTGAGSDGVAFNNTLDQLGGDYATGSGIWDPSTASESKSYEIAVTLGSDTTDTYQGESITALNFTWEVQAGS